jgi:hypothetical protein
VKKAMVLYAMHNFMTQILLFTDDSADMAIKSLQQPTKLPYTRTLTSKLIGLQIKRVMYGLIRDGTVSLLRELDKTMLGEGKRTKAEWASSFCVISILSMCVEMVQIATDLKIVHLVKEEKGKSSQSRAKSGRLCQELDFRFISNWEEIFHKAFKSYKPMGSRKNERGFNPIRDGLDIDDGEDHVGAIVKLVDQVRRVLTEYGNCPTHLGVK